MQGLIVKTTFIQKHIPVCKTLLATMVSNGQNAVKGVVQIKLQSLLKIFPHYMTMFLKLVPVNIFDKIMKFLRLFVFHLFTIFPLLVWKSHFKTKKRSELNTDLKKHKDGDFNQQMMPIKNNNNNNFLFHNIRKLPEANIVNHAAGSWQKLVSIDSNGSLSIKSPDTVIFLLKRVFIINYKNCIMK